MPAYPPLRGVKACRAKPRTNGCNHWTSCAMKDTNMNPIPERPGSPDDNAAITLRPDGYYWAAPNGRGDVGPFTTWAEALADMATDDDTPEVGETLQEAEADIGIADWIDPETGEPAEGLCPPHLDED